MVETSIVIPSYRRPEGLRKAILSCLAQEGVSTAYEIVVVDNDPKGSARPVATALAATSAVRIRYIAEPQRGISFARNTGVAHARGQLLAFLDDDEEAAPHWLASFLDTLRRFDADAAVGPTYPRFPGEAGEIHPYARSVYTRDAGAQSGTRLLRWSIGNSIFHKERCFVGPEPFDRRLGLTGGEDTVFIRQMTRRGCKFVWCAEAMVSEDIPADRLRPRYLLRRAFRGGQTAAFVCILVPPRELRRAARLIVGGAVQLVVCGPLGLLLRLFNRPRWLPMMARAAAGLGKLLFHPMLQLRLYR